MARILTGIQSSGQPHLGNVLGAIIPAIELSRSEKNDSLFFIADLHALTSIKNSEIIKRNTYSSAAAWLAFGFDTDKNILFKQSDVTEVCELTWYLNCFTPYPMLAKAHSFKDKSDRLAEVNAGLFIYPVLMAADILLYDVDIVPVGTDQKQHLEMTRDIGRTFNNMYGDTFVIPKPRIDPKVMTIPGIDGQKMSKSYNNIIDIFESEQQLKKMVMSIMTDSKTLEQPKDPETCTVFHLYSLIASEDETENMRNNYKVGNYGYGHAKKALFELIINKYSKERKLFNEYMNNLDGIEKKLVQGADKAKSIATKVLDRVRRKLGY